MLTFHFDRCVNRRLFKTSIARDRLWSERLIDVLESCCMTTLFYNNFKEQSMRQEGGQPYRKQPAYA